MPALVDIDAFGVDRIEQTLEAGTTLAGELMRIYPEGLACDWRIYAGEVDEARMIAPEDLSQTIIDPASVFVLVRRPGTPDIWINLAISIVLSLAARMLMPKPRKGIPRAQEGQDSGTNQLAGQTNVLRPGARVPDVLGTMRVYPDLLTQPVERWNLRTQTIRQYFVIGVGDYELTQHKLGESPLASLESWSIDQYAPGDIVPHEGYIPGGIECVRISSTVNAISLNGDDGGAITPTSKVDFQASPPQMSSLDRLPLSVGFVTIAGTSSNDGVRYIVSTPDPAQTAGPYLYPLVGPVINQTNTMPGISQWFHQLTQGFSGCSMSGNRIEFDLAYYLGSFRDGRAVRIEYGATTWYGILENVVLTPINPSLQHVRMEVRDLAGVPITFPTVSNVILFMQVWSPPEPAGGGGGATHDNAPTGWHAVPIANPKSILIDVQFPQGLVKYDADGYRRDYTVEVRADFRRIGSTTGAVSIILGTYTASVNAMLQFTEEIEIDSLGLAGSGPIECRLFRVTPNQPSVSGEQIVAETRWQMLRGLVLLAPRTFDEVTVVSLFIQNSRSAASVGENTYNCVATRKLPQWSAGSWSAPVPTDRWADNFIARVKAVDGAHLPDAYIDLAGIYALQSQLDLLDDGEQGRIALAIDQLQDIDAELAQIADVVRSGVYRVGRKIFVARDQANATPIALFNGRAKAVDGESISTRMKSDDENDAVAVTWVDEVSGWKLRELIYSDPPNPQPSNPLRVGVQCANWAQVWRRAVFEWNRIRYRRERMVVSVTEDGRICRPGDVINVTDDIGNLAIAAGEVITVLPGNLLVIDRDVAFGAGTHTILLRDVEGVNVDAVACTAVAGQPNRVQLARAPTVTIKGRDISLGTLFSFYEDAKVTVRRWLLSSVETTSPPWVQLVASNYSDSVYQGDAGALPDWPAIGGPVITG